MIGTKISKVQFFQNLVKKYFELNKAQLALTSIVGEDAQQRLVRHIIRSRGDAQQQAAGCNLFLPMQFASHPKARKWLVLLFG